MSVYPTSRVSNVVNSTIVNIIIKRDLTPKSYGCYGDLTNKI
jgi:hypothetical protein